MGVNRKIDIAAILRGLQREAGTYDLLKMYRVPWDTSTPDGHSMRLVV